MTLLFGKERILILGASGLFGSFLVPHLLSLGCKPDIGAHVRVDMIEKDEAFAKLNSIAPTVIINLIAMTDVDRCQTDPQQAYLLNVRVIENIAAWVRVSEAHCHLIQFSTDQVYDGPGPHSEDQITLTNLYAFSKYAGELAAAQIPSSILRTNFIGRSLSKTRKSLSDWLFTALSSNTSIQVFDDVLFSPLSMDTLAQMVFLCVQQKPSGLFNLGSNHGMSKSDFAFAFAHQLGLGTQNVHRTTSDAVTFLKTYRPKDMRMLPDQFAKFTKTLLPSFSDEIKLVAKQYENT